MAKLTINRGSTANDGSGDNLREGANKVNLNFDEIYTAIGDGSTVNGTWKLQDDSSTESVISANGEVLRVLGGSGITSTLSGNDLTVAVDGTVLSASQTSTLTNKTINGPDNTLTNIANASLANSSITVSDGSNSTARALGSTLTIQGTSNEVEVAASTGTLTVGLPNNVTISGNLTVQGTTTTINSTTIDVTNSFTFEGTTSDGHETTLTVVDPTADRTVSIPNATGTIVLKDTTDTLTNKTIDSDNNTITNIVDADIKSSAAIANSKLANSSVTIGADTIALGGTQTTITDLNLDGTSSLSGTGTISTTGSANKIRFNYANTGALPSASTYEGMFAYDIGGNNPYVADAGGWVKLITENASIADLSNVGSIASISNGQALIWNSGAGRFDPGAVGGDVVDDTTPQLGGDLDAQGNHVQDAGYVSHRSPDATVTQTLAVTVVTKTTEHTAYGDGSSSGYAIDGHEGPHLQLSRGTYKFDLSSSSSSHPFRLYEDESKNIAYTTGVTTSGSGGSAGDHLTIVIDDNTVTPIFYQCSAHGNMGGRIDIIGGKRRRLNITTDKSFTGDGSDTTQTILANRTVDDVLVFVNGICLVPTDDYTISGTTLTYQVAPANGAECVIRYLG